MLRTQKNRYKAVNMSLEPKDLAWLDGRTPCRQFEVFVLQNKSTVEEYQVGKEPQNWKEGTSYVGEKIINSN